MRRRREARVVRGDAGEARRGLLGQRGAAVAVAAVVVVVEEVV